MPILSIRWAMVLPLVLLNIRICKPAHLLMCPILNPVPRTSTTATPPIALILRFPPMHRSE